MLRARVGRETLPTSRLLSSAIGLSGSVTLDFPSPIGALSQRSITEFTLGSFQPTRSPLHQDGGRRSWWEIQKHSQQKLEDPSGLLISVIKVREAGGRRGQGTGGSGSISALEGRRVSWVPPCRPSFPLPTLPSPCGGPPQFSLFLWGWARGGAWPLSVCLIYCQSFPLGSPGPQKASLGFGRDSQVCPLTHTCTDSLSSASLAVEACSLDFWVSRP